MAKRQAKPPAKAAPKRAGKAAKDVDYTIPALITLVAIVLITALFFAEENVALGANFGGKAYDTGSVDAAAAKTCEAASRCDGSRLVRQGTDCKEYVAYCTYGCVFDAQGYAVCAS